MSGIYRQVLHRKIDLYPSIIKFFKMSQAWVKSWNDPFCSCLIQLSQNGSKLNKTHDLWSPGKNIPMCTIKLKEIKGNINKTANIKGCWIGFWKCIRTDVLSNSKSGLHDAYTWDCSLGISLPVTWKGQERNNGSAHLCWKTLFTYIGGVLLSAGTSRDAQNSG